MTSSSSMPSAEDNKLTTQESIDLLTASAKFVPSSSSSISSSSSSSSSGGGGGGGKPNNMIMNMNNNKLEDMEDIDSNDDDPYDDDLMDCDQKGGYKLNSGVNSGSGMMMNSNNNPNMIPNLTEDDKRKRRAIANSNERRRMQSINVGFQNLKTIIPHSSGEKLSKACILQRSADYMQYLANEKDKVTQKFQIAIKLIESNGLLAQLQTKINARNELQNNNSSSKSNKRTITPSDTDDPVPIDPKNDVETLTSPSNVSCRQLSDTTNIISFENNNLLVLPIPNLDLDPTTVISQDLKTLNPIVVPILQPLQHSQIINNSTQDQIVDSSKKIANLLRCTDLLNNNNNNSPNKKHIKQIVQNQSFAPVDSSSQIKISNADLIKLIELKVNSNETNEFILNLIESLKSYHTTTLQPSLPSKNINEFTIIEECFKECSTSDINNNAPAIPKINKANKKSFSNKISKLNEQNENLSNENNNNLENDSSAQSHVVPTSSNNSNTIKSLTSSPLPLINNSKSSTSSSSSNKIRHISQLEHKSQQQQPQSQNKNVNHYLSSISPNSQQQQPIVASVLNNKSYLIKSSRSNSIDQLIAAAAVTSLPSTSNDELTDVVLEQNLFKDEDLLLESNGSLKISESSSSHELSVSRKNLNTIVEAIFHVEGNLIYELEEDRTCLMMPSSSNNYNQLQLQKPPKKRKYTTEDISQMLPQIETLNSNNKSPKINYGHQNTNASIVSQNPNSNNDEKLMSLLLSTS